MTASFARSLLFSAVLLAACAGPALAQAPARGAAAAPRLPAYNVQGFRSARFGQTQEQVLAAIQKDLGVKPADVQKLASPVDGTTALAANLPQMEPAPGAATVTYIFGKAGLIHVNVVWLMIGDVPPLKRTELVGAGVKLADYFKTFSWAPNSVLENVPTGPNAITMFIAKDGQGDAVEINANGVAFRSSGPGGQQVNAPAPTGAARLRVSYGSVNEGKAVTPIRPGQF